MLVRRPKRNDLRALLSVALMVVVWLVCVGGAAARVLPAVKVRFSYVAPVDRVVSRARLVASGLSGRLGFLAADVSGRTVVGHSFSASMPLAETGVDVFGEPASGWSDSTPSARLSAANGEALGPVAVSGTTVVAGAPEVALGGPGAVYVFTEPGQGWAGDMHESAKLIASDAAPGARLGGSVAVAGSLVFATGGGRVYVFREPAGGWSGTVSESAELAASDSAALGTVAVSAGTIVAGSDGAAYVFREPSRGWSGTVHEAAKLVPSDPEASIGGDSAFGHSVGVSGRTVVVGGGVMTGSRLYNAEYVFTRPAAGWSGTMHQRAELRYPIADYTLPNSVAVSGQTVAEITPELGNGPNPHECPCGAPVHATSRPAHGWSSMTVPRRSAFTVVDGALKGISMNGQTLVIPATDAVHVYTVIPPPRLVSATLTGTASRTPRLTLKLQAPHATPPIKSVTLQPAAGLHTATNRKQLARGIRTHPAQHTFMLEGDKLHVTLAKPTRSLSLTLTPPALNETRALTRRIDHLITFNRTRRHKHKKRLNLHLLLQATDAQGQLTALPVTLSMS